MGIQDRDWYIEAQRQREARERRQAVTRFVARTPGASIFRMILVWVALMTALYAGYSHFFKVKPVTVTANGEIRVTRSQDGHHYLSGVINGQSIRFLIDTGATYTSVSEVFAQKALLEGGNRATSQTANGPIPIRLVRDVNIKIGDIDVSGLTVSVGLRGLQDDLGLLGQNFLSQFDAITQGNVLILKPRER
ncbi:MAG: hypothetical protein RL758_614 [Pseudomonadota bacterium]|jgi:aspartyl protease family protein